MRRLKKERIRNVILVIVFVAFTACHTEETKKVLVQKSSDQDHQEPKKTPQPTLTIEGDNIWCRITPVTGAVVMKRQDGDVCAILDTSKVDTIKGCIDVWYQVAFQDTLGWVFGSQTNLKSKSSQETKAFLKQYKHKLTCEKLTYRFINDDKNRYLENILVYTGEEFIDTINVKGRGISALKNEWQYLIKCKDLNFDGIVDLILEDDLTASHGAMNYYHCFFDLTTKRYVEAKGFPIRHGGIKINPKQREVIIFCSYHDCKGTYKFRNNRFVIVSGQFSLEP